jgi:hypothetical protein
MTDAAVGREVQEVLRRRMWIHPEQVRVHVDDGTTVLTGAVGRRSTAGIATRLARTVPGATRVVDRIRYDFDDSDLVDSAVDRTHPFSAEPFPPGCKRRRGPLSALGRRTRRR